MQGLRPLRALTAHSVMRFFFSSRIRHTRLVGDWSSDVCSSDLRASTATFLGVVIMQVGNIFACRSFRDSVFRPGFFANRLIFIGIAFEVLLTFFIIYHPWGNKLFSTAPLPLSVWLALISSAAFLLFADEARKLIAKKLSR